MDNTKQMPLIEPQTAWFHVFKHMVDSGDVARMGPHATTVYLVIKSYTNWKHGKAWPGNKLIAEKSGISERKVDQCLKVLESSGYITKEKRGRKNFYTLKEKITITDGHGRPQSEATWDYLPSTIGDAVSEIRNFVATGGQGKDFKIIHIEHLILNLQQNYSGDNSQNNVNLNIDKKGVQEILKLPEDNPIKRAYLKALARQSSNGADSQE